MKDFFHKIAVGVSEFVGSPWSFIGAILVIFLWAITGPVFKFSDTWQLVINTSTTIVTFLMVFLIQNTQNREARVTQLKLDELIRSQKAARNGLINLENMSEEELSKLQEEFSQLREKFHRAHPSINGDIILEEDQKERSE